MPWTRCKRLLEDRLHNFLQTPSEEESYDKVAALVDDVGDVSEEVGVTVAETRNVYKSSHRASTSEQQRHA